MQKCSKAFLKFDISIAAPPSRNKQLVSNMDLSLPVYQFRFMASLLTMRASEFRRTRKRSLARPVDIIPALHPIPERLKLVILLLITNLLTIKVLREGVGQNMQEFVIRMSISLGFMLVFSSSIFTTEKTTVCVSSMENEMDLLMGRQVRAGGTLVSSPNPDFSRILTWKSMLS